MLNNVKKTKEENMRRIKKRVKAWKIIVLVLVLIIALDAAARYLISESNYEYNKTAYFFVSSSNYANTENFINFKYGLNSDVEKNYSMMRATFNAIKYLNKSTDYNYDLEPNIPDMIKYYDLYAQLAFGYFVNNPLAVSNYINSLDGLKASIHFSKENIAEAINSSAVGILFNTNLKTQEFIAVRPNLEAANRMYIIRTNNNTVIKTVVDSYGDNFIAFIAIDIE